jgi:hypothetical protein
MPAEGGISGENAKVTFTTLGTSPVTTILNNASYSLTRDPKIKDVSNTKVGRKRIKTLSDYTGSVKGFFDPGDRYLDAITEGVEGVFKFYITDTAFWVLPAIVGTISENSNGVEDAFDYDFEVMQSGGVPTPPVWT